jgi:transcriptional regulator
MYLPKAHQFSDRDALLSLMESHPFGRMGVPRRWRPTWNHAVTHPHGVARVIVDHEWLLGMLDRLTDAQESRRPVPWHVGDAPAACIDKMLRAIVGIEIRIDRLEGKLRVSQDEALQDRIGTGQGLQTELGDEACALARLAKGAIEAESPSGE